MNVKKTIKKLTAAALALSLGGSLAGCTPQKADISSFFSSDGKVSYCTDYKELSPSKTNSTESWRNGMVCGNGRQGAVVSGSPYEDTLIFQNIHFIMPNNNPRTCPDTSDELENVKQSIVKGEDITDDARYDEDADQYDTDDGCCDLMFLDPFTELSFFLFLHPLCPPNL